MRCNGIPTLFYAVALDGISTGKSEAKYLDKGGWVRERARERDGEIVDARLLAIIENEGKF